MNTEKDRAFRNRTIFLKKDEIPLFKGRLISLTKKVSALEIENQTVLQDIFKGYQFLPEGFVDLLFIDPPYNQNKDFNSNRFREMKDADYEVWIDSWLSKLIKILKPTASVYICGDWKSAGAISRVMSKYFIVRNRITWEREKGRGAKSNWKNCSEDIWFGTVSENYHFNPEAVKLKRKVLAPYRDENRRPKDWLEESQGNYRLTYPSNLWTDITIPFWSMPENTDHPTQKPEKLMAKIILASSRESDFVFDPFLGSGSTSVVAKKLNRKYCGVEIDEKFACLSEKRLELANRDKTIQGYNSGVFWERNSLNEQKNGESPEYTDNQTTLVFKE